MKFIQLYLHMDEEMIPQNIIQTRSIIDIQLGDTVTKNEKGYELQVYHPINWIDKHHNEPRGEAYARTKEEIYYIKAEDLHKLMR